MVFSILSYFTISKNYFINYTISFYNIPNIPKLYFFFILFKYSFLILFLLFLFFSSFSSLSPSTSSKPIPSKITTKNHPNQTSIRNPPTTPAKSQKIQNPQQITRQSPIQIQIKNQNQNPKSKIHSKSLTDLRSKSKSKSKTQNQNQKPTTDPRHHYHRCTT